MDDIRKMVRQVLREELAQIRSARNTAVEEELVTIGNDTELNAFVQRVLKLADDTSGKANIAAGRHVFKLRQTNPAGHSNTSPTVSTKTSAARVRFSKSMLTERDVAGFPEGTVAIMTDKKVRLTPLARDEIRRRKIQIEKVAR
jgi:hypothetical protein